MPSDPVFRRKTGRHAALQKGINRSETAGKERQPPFAEGKIAGGGRSVHLHKAPFGTEPALRRVRKGSG